jgi:phosphomannomutase
MHLLSRLRQQCNIGYVSGSNLVKQQEQLSTLDVPVTMLFDFCFAENGLVSFRLGEPLRSPSFTECIGKGPYQQLVKWMQYYVDDLEVPFERGSFPESVELRHGMINVPFIRREASYEERDNFERRAVRPSAWDQKENGARGQEGPPRPRREVFDWRAGFS